MKIEYFSDTDTIYIDLRDEPGVDAEEIAPGVVVDYGADGKLVGIEFDSASSVTDVRKLETNLDTRRVTLKPTA